MFQKSLLKSFTKSFNAPNSNESISFLSQMQNWQNCVREVKNDTDMKNSYYLR